MIDRNLDEELKEIDYTHLPYPEIFIGLVSPLGVDLNAVCDELSSALLEVGYSPELVKLSDLLKEEKIQKIHKEVLENGPEDKRIHSLMTAGNELRKTMKRKDALALFTVAKIREIRKKEKESPDSYIDKKAYILRSFKNKEEITTLKNIYGSSFFLISAYSPREKRKNDLSKRIAASLGKASNADKYTAAAEKLINRDYNEESHEFGQEVSDAFPLADLFVEVEDTRTHLKESIVRFVNSLFGYPFYTPTKNEFGMFLAFSVALRSADLSRQVGAAVLDKNGDLLAIGCNEVPKFGGGQYWEDDAINKARDFEIGYDSSSYMKKEILEETISDLKDLNIIEDSRTPSEITQTLLFGENSGKMKNADITNLLEYGRMVHAEMAVISDAAKRGISLKGATLYCTTFPCHMCARHIIAAGIKKVVYVEPYPKSKAQKLYPDSIVVDAPQEIEDKVAFVPFVGIAPYRFHDFFKHKKRKDSQGNRQKWSAKEARLKIRVFNPLSYINIETDFANLAGKIVEKLGVT